MKGNLLGALLVSVCLAGQSFGAGLLDRMLGSGCGCDSCEPSCCCEKSCGCPTDCCEDPCCGSSCCKERCCLLGRLFGCKHKHNCCEASCCATDNCCEDACCEASCGCPDDCCEPACGCASKCGCKRGCFLSRLFARKCCKSACCEASCCCEDTCCEASCGCDSGCTSGCSSCAPAGDVSNAPEAAPIPPAPVADPAARIAQPRKVVSASFVR